MMEVFLVIIYTLLFIFIIHRLSFFNVKGLAKKHISLLFILKIVCGIILGLIYTYHYPDKDKLADTFIYFNGSHFLYELFFDNPFHFFQLMTIININDHPDLQPYIYDFKFWIPENYLIIRLNALFRFFSFGYYYVHVVFINFLALIGLMALYKLFMKNFSDYSNRIIAGIFLIPSVLFWGSGVLKEAIFLFSLGVFLYMFQQLMTNGWSLKRLFWIILGLYLLGVNKMYILAILLPVIAAYGLSLKSAIPKRQYLFGVVYAGIIIMGIMTDHFLLDSKILKTISLKQSNFIDYAITVDANSLINVAQLEPNIVSFTKNAPQAFVNSMFRPHILESGSLMILAAALENIAIIILLLVSLMSLKLNRMKYLLNISIIQFAMYFTVSLFVFIGLIVPVLGALVRYKIPALPFLVIFLLLIVDKQVLTTRVPFLKKFI